MKVALQIANPSRREAFTEVPDALVDTGATWTTVPRRIATELQLDIVGKVRVRTASGVQELDQSYAFLRLQGKQLVSFVQITDTYPNVLIGVTTLEGLGFAVDPVNERLIESELLLL